MADFKEQKPSALPALLLLHPDDNVLVALATIAAGQQVSLGTESFVVNASLELGHKIARTAIAKGDRVAKYGATIGLASQDIARGEHVHLHNLASQYTVIEDMDK